MMGKFILGSLRFLLRAFQKCGHRCDRFVFLCGWALARTVLWGKNKYEMIEKLKPRLIDLILFIFQKCYNNFYQLIASRQ